MAVVLLFDFLVVCVVALCIQAFPHSPCTVDDHHEQLKLGRSTVQQYCTSAQ